MLQNQHHLHNMFEKVGGCYRQMSIKRLLVLNQYRFIMKPCSTHVNMEWTLNNDYDKFSNF